ncbi:MAG TPA: adaptor protein MecA [Candidatus Limivivens intestinipullorum]|uniref:Adaptor protein MecA n=1 Tax=Candidatus Limivivens intestinipullorum TaxID=2840858 RepID=A0A9D1EUB8_9FIRM|nr:adaptor protein MecA [Candidatus Limivivens intestinipullorum]
MTFWRINDTKISCRITMDEIHEMGFDFQELTQDRQKTTEFLSTLMEKARTSLQGDLPDGIQSFSAQMLPDASVLITISCVDIEKEINDNMDLLERRIQAMNEMEKSGRLDRVRSLEGQEKAEAYNELMEDIENLLQDPSQEEEEQTQVRRLDMPGSSTCRILFPSLDETIHFCQAVNPESVAHSRLYKHGGWYYLYTDFEGDAREKKAAGFLNLAGEFGGDISGEGASEAFLKEHKKCMIPEQAVRKLNGLVK